MYDPIEHEIHNRTSKLLTTVYLVMGLSVVVFFIMMALIGAPIFPESSSETSAPSLTPTITPTKILEEKQTALQTTEPQTTEPQTTELSLSQAAVWLIVAISGFLLITNVVWKIYAIFTLPF